MIPKQATDHLWSIVLAGGEGERTRPFIEQWLGYPLPKQYCTFIGTRSMLQHTLDRADQLSRKDQKVTVVSRTHHQQAWPHLERQLSGQIILQPRNCNTAAGIFLPLTYVLARDQNATVVIYPSDHFVYPENRFVETVRRAIRAAEVLAERLIVLGVRPTRLELDYGWIEVSSHIGWSTGSSVQQVKAFIEKPNAIDGLAAMAEGALWNTLVLAAKAETIWNLGWRCFPEVMERFEQLRKSIGTQKEGQTLQAIYCDMPHRNFSSDLLHYVPENVGVMEMDEILWSDWGQPRRIVETLRVIGKEPAFSLADSKDSGHPWVPPSSMEVA